MGSLELTLLLKYGVPLAIKLLKSGKSEIDTVDDVTEAISGLATSENAVDELVGAKPEQAESIVDGLFGVIVGVADAFSHLVGALVGLLIKKDTE